MIPTHTGAALFQLLGYQTNWDRVPINAQTEVHLIRTKKWGHMFFFFNGRKKVLKILVIGKGTLKSIKNPPTLWNKASEGLLNDY